MKKLKDFIWFYIVQIMASSIIIYTIDKIFAMTGMDIYVGINIITMGFVGFAGIPGVIALFSLAFILKSA